MHDLALYCLVVLVTCVTPGAGVLYTVTSALRGGMRTVLLIAIFAGTCFCVHVGYSLVAACASRYLAGPRFSLWLNRLSALLFWLLAASVLWNIALG